MNKIPVVILLILLILLIFYFYLFLSKKYIEKYENNDLFNIINKSYVINLINDSVGKKRLAKLKNNNIIKKYVNIFPAIYGKTYNYNIEIKNNIIGKTWDYGKWSSNNSKIIKLTDGEIGCILSHYYLWKKIVSEKTPITLILEDDASRPCNNFEKLTLKYYKHLPNDWDIFLLGFWLHTGDKDKKINNYIFKVNEFALTHSYLITYKGAQKLLNLVPINMPVDTWLSSVSNIVNIYRHNYVKNPKIRPASLLIRQGLENDSRIIHTNNYIKKSKYNSKR